MPGRLVILSTSHRVAPGLLTATAWDELRAADVVAASEDHPQVPYLAEAGVTCTAMPEEAPADLAGRLLEWAADRTVVWIAGTGTGDELAEELARRLVEGGTAVEAEVLPGSYDLPGGRLLDLVAVMDRLRTECPWDREQTHATLAPYLIEEAYETVDTIESGDLAALREELGDVLLQVMFHSRVAAERTDDTGFTVDDVAAGIVDKMVRRHPHVFADVAVAGGRHGELGRDQGGRTRRKTRRRGIRPRRRPTGTAGPGPGRGPPAPRRTSGPAGVPGNGARRGPRRPPVQPGSSIGGPPGNRAAHHVPCLPRTLPRGRVVQPDDPRGVASRLERRLSQDPALNPSDTTTRGS